MTKNNKNIFKILPFVVVLSLALVISACGNNKANTTSSEPKNMTDTTSDSTMSVDTQSDMSSSQHEHAGTALTTLEGICIKDNLFLCKDGDNYSLIYITTNDKTELKPGHKYSFKVEGVMTSLPAQANTDEMKLIGPAVGEKLPWEALQALQMLTEHGNLPIHLVDVRNEDEFKEGHVPNSVNIPMSDISSIEKTVPKTDVVIVYCRSGNRSASAAKELEKMGYNLVFDLGGIQDYKGDIEK